MDKGHRNRVVGIVTLLLIVLALSPLFFRKKIDYTESNVPLIEVSRQETRRNQDNFPSVEHVLSLVRDKNEPEFLGGREKDEPVSKPKSPQGAQSITVAKSTKAEQPKSSKSVAKPLQPVATKNKALPTVANNKRQSQYVVQLVALKSARRIEELTALLVLNNFSVYTEPAQPKNGELIRLFVGPYSTQRSAEVSMKNLTKLTELKGQVRLQ